MFYVFCQLYMAKYTNGQHTSTGVDSDGGAFYVRLLINYTKLFFK